MEFSDYPVWNGLFYGSERKIVQKIGHADGYDLWVAVYYVTRSRAPHDLDFIQNATADFCIIIFRYKAGTDLMEVGFRKQFFEQLEVKYVDSKEEILKFLVDHSISLDQFQYPRKVDFPMGR